MNNLNIDWAAYPCEQCPSYGNTDDCVCSKLDKWTKEQEKTVKQKPCTTDTSNYSNEHLMDVARAYANEHIICVDDCPYTISDTKHAVRDAYYAGFEDFYKTIIKPMYEVFLKTNTTENPYNTAYKLALEDIIKVSGFSKQ